MFKNLYKKCLDLAGHKSSKYYLAIVSFVESSFFPIPPDIILIPMVLANRIKAWLYASICTISSVIGGIAGYFIGFFFYNSIGIKIVQYYSLENLFSSFESSYNDYGILIVLGAGFTPFPFKFITIASGLFGLNLPLFISVAFFARGLRFFLVAGLIKLFGNFIKNLIDRYFNIIATLFFLLLIGSFILIKYL